jgi:hypothetical protein
MDLTDEAAHLDRPDKRRDKRRKERKERIGWLMRGI